MGRSREAARLASIEAEGLRSRYLEDHPELAGTAANTGDYYVRRVAMDDAVASARAPVEQRFFDAIEHRRGLTHRMALASPTSLLAMTLDELAGSSDERVGRFRREVDAFQSRFATFFNGKTMRGERLSVASLAERPVFRFEEPPLAVWPLSVLAAWALALFGLALRRFPRSVDLDDIGRRHEPAGKLEASAA